MSGPAAEFFQALSDETRLRLLERLRAGERTVGELVEELGCPQPKVSRHLKVLREVGLVRDQRDGRHVTYALRARKSWPPEAVAWLERLEAGLAATALAGASPRPALAARPEDSVSVADSAPSASVRAPDSIETHLL